MANKKVTSYEIATTASKVLRNPNSSEIAKQVAGSALSQKNKTHETGKNMETIASNILKSNKYNEVTKELAASILSQSDKNR
jgi:hypothetical protein